MIFFGKLIQWSNLALWRGALPTNLRLVATNGCFDILHVGHVDYLRQSMAYGDVLIVGINSDESVRALKGPSRPVNSALSRAAVLCALESVDAVTIFDDRTAESFLEAVAPHVWVKGGDYSLETVDPGERQVVQKRGGDIVFIPFAHHISTTQILAHENSRPV